MGERADGGLCGGRLTSESGCGLPVFHFVSPEENQHRKQPINIATGCRSSSAIVSLPLDFLLGTRGEAGDNRGTPGQSLLGERETTGSPAIMEYGFRVDVVSSSTERLVLLITAILVNMIANEIKYLGVSLLHT